MAPSQNRPEAETQTLSRKGQPGKATGEALDRRKATRDQSTTHPGTLGRRYRHGERQTLHLDPRRTENWLSPHWKACQQDRRRDQSRCLQLTPTHSTPCQINHFRQRHRVPRIQRTRIQTRHHRLLCPSTSRLGARNQ